MQTGWDDSKKYSAVVSSVDGMAGPAVTPGEAGGKRRRGRRGAGRRILGDSPGEGGQFAEVQPHEADRVRGVAVLQFGGQRKGVEGMGAHALGEAFADFDAGCRPFDAKRRLSTLINRVESPINESRLASIAMESAEEAAGNMEIR